MLFILPVLVITIISCLIVVERHHKSISRKMSGNFSNALLYALENAEVNSESKDNFYAQLQSGLKELGADVSQENFKPTDDISKIWDISGSAARKQIMLVTSRAEEVYFSERPSRVNIVINAKFGTLTISAPRDLVTPRNPHQLIIIIILSGAALSIVIFTKLRHDIKSVKELAAAVSNIGITAATTFGPNSPREVYQAKEALKSMSEQINDQEKEMSVFLHGVSHDLRTPLTRMRIGLELLDNVPSVVDLQREVQTLSELVDKNLKEARKSFSEHP